MNQKIKEVDLYVNYHKIFQFKPILNRDIRTFLIDLNDHETSRIWQARFFVSTINFNIKLPEFILNGMVKYMNDNLRALRFSLSK